MDRYAAIELADEAKEALKLERRVECQALHHRFNLHNAGNVPKIASQEALKNQGRPGRMKREITQTSHQPGYYETDPLSKIKNKWENKRTW